MTNKIKNIIQQLQQKTTENGCSKAEALAAIDKVNTLLQKHDLSLVEVDKFSTQCEDQCELTSVSKSSRERPIDLIIPELTAFCDVKAWINGRKTGYRTSEQKYQFLGFPTDVKALLSTFKIIEEALTHATIKFKISPQYQGRASTNSFQKGFILSVCQTLERLKAERNAAQPSVHGTALVVLKQNVIDKEFDNLNLKMREAKNQTMKLSDSNAFFAGRARGKEFNLNKRIA